ncbi:MAG: sigma-54-dependent transcriptional regulator [Hyphomicrobiales bacterium]
MKILVVEDTPSVAKLYAEYLSRAGHDTSHAACTRQAHDLLAASKFDVHLIDLCLPDGSGAELIAEISGRGGTAVAVTADASISTAVEAVRRGAHDCLVKPVSSSRLIDSLESAGKAEEASPLPCSPAQGENCKSENGFVGTSHVMQAIYETVEQVAPSKAGVFITGESGTGKEVCAEAIHNASPRANEPFVALNCSAIPRDLMESEIFGHLKGSFTGAIADRQGAASQAHGGTLFLDEICELDFELQSKLLRFLQTGVIQPVGSARIEKVDVRVICATNKSPEKEVREGRFRQDLYYRLHVIPIHMPPLNARGEDIMQLANHFLELYSREENKRFKRFSETAKAALEGFGWPGNVRELQNVIRQAAVLYDGAEVSLDMLPVRIHAPAVGLNWQGAKFVLPAAGMQGEALWKIERAAITSTIASCGGSIPKAAKILGISPSTIYRKRESWPKMEARTA